MTKTEYLEQICFELGVDVSALPDRLIATYLSAISQALGVKREEGTLSEYLSDFAQNWENAFEQGKKVEYDRFWEQFQQGGNRTNYRNGYYSVVWTDDIYRPLYPYKLVGNNAYVFCNARMTDILKTIDVTEATETTSLFAYNGLLKTVPLIKITEATTFTLWFDYCSGLESVTFDGVIGQNGLNVQWSTNLTHDSLMGIINALQDKSGDTSGTTWIVTIGTTNKAKLTEEELLIAYNKGWDVR